MSNEWTLGPTRIFVQEMSDDALQVVARLVPLASGTILQTFGWEDLIKNLQGKIVGSTDKVSLLDMTRSGLSYTLSGMGFSWGEYYVKSVKYKTKPTARQTLRLDLDEQAFVYDVSVELFKDE